MNAVLPTPALVCVRQSIFVGLQSTAMRIRSLLATLLFAATATAQSTFTNPVLDHGPDPWVVRYKGSYFYMNTTGKDLQIRKTTDMASLDKAAPVVVWTPEPGHSWSKELWAPELHRWGNKWYIYFAADAGKNEDHRIYVVENLSDDPTQGTWTLKGKVADSTDKWAIDASVFEHRGQHYIIWSGWQGDHDGEQDIFIAHMSNPWTIDSPRTLIGKPAYEWELHGDLPGRHVSVNEGPEFLPHGDKVFVTFSANGCWTDFYSLGELEAKANANLLDARSWTKINHPFFTTDASAHAYSPGHNGFFTAPNGQNWIVYHANPEPGQGCGNHRSPRIQPFTWNADGTPNFGKPVSIQQPIPRPQ